MIHSRPAVGKVSTNMDSVESIVMSLEAELLQPETRINTQRLDALLARDFLEVGAAGRSFGKSDVLARLPREDGVTFVATEMQAQAIAATVVLVTYRAARMDLGCT